MVGRVAGWEGCLLAHHPAAGRGPHWLGLIRYFAPVAARP